MKVWVRQQILILRACFFNASHWVRQQIPVLRERFHNIPYVYQILLITILLLTISFLTYFFIAQSLIGEIFAGVIFTALIIGHLHRSGLTTLKHLFRKKDHSENNGKDPFYNEELQRLKLRQRVFHFFR